MPSSLPGYLLRFLSDNQKADFKRLADETGISLNQWLLGLGERELLRKRRRDAEVQELKALEQQHHTKWQEIVLHWEQRGAAAARSGRDKWIEVGQDLWGKRLSNGFKYCTGSGTDDPAPKISTGKGRAELEAAKLLRHYCWNHGNSSKATRGYTISMMDKLFEEFLALEDELADRRGLDGGGALAMALAATPWGAHRAQRRREEEDDVDYENFGDDDNNDYGGGGGGDDDSGGGDGPNDDGDNPDDSESDSILDEGDENEEGDGDD
jgi:hypothetical protein